jgi:hypothetical protein
MGAEDSPHVDKSPVLMKSLKYLSYVGKFAGLVTALDGIPFVDPSVGIIVFAAASLLKDSVNRIGDLLDDGKPNQSFRG